MWYWSPMLGFWLHISPATAAELWADFAIKETLGLGLIAVSTANLVCRLYQLPRKVVS